MRLCVFAWIVCLLAAGAVTTLALDDSPDSTSSLEFPHRLRIAPGNVLFVHGHEFRDEIVFTWQEGDTLRIEGLPVLPPPSAPTSRLADDRLESLYGEVPYVQNLVAEGHSWRDAASAYNLRRGEFAKTLERVFWNALAVSGSESLAVKAVRDSMDWTIVSPSPEPKVTARGVGLAWKGMKYWYSIGFSDTPPDGPPTPGTTRYTEKYIKSIVRGISERLGGEIETRWMEIISGGHTTLGGESVAEALRQIQEAENGRSIEGPLTERELLQILQVRGGVLKDED